MSGSLWQQSLRGLASAGAAMAKPLLQQGPALTVAIPFDHFGAWAAQTSFLRSVAVSMHRAAHSAARVLVINISGVSGEQALSPDLRDLVINVERDVWQTESERTALLSSLGVDCVLSLFGPPPRVSGLGLVGWLADFQHFRMPQFFSPKESAARDEVFRDIICRCDRVLLSSRDAERDCLRFDAQAHQKTRVHPFPSGLIFQSLMGATEKSVTEKYHLPTKFMLVANQFWAHKNHLTIVEGARLAAERGLRVPIVLTGLPSDYRDASNGLVSRVLQAIAVAGLRDCIVPLGQVPYADLVDLLRSAALIVQPSSFEGWSTTVQDAKALGRPVACSSIALHREQAPNAAGFFGPTEPSELADLLQRIWPNLQPGPDQVTEGKSLTQEQQFARDYGLALWHTCAEASASARAP